MNNEAIKRVRFCTQHPGTDVPADDIRAILDLLEQAHRHVYTAADGTCLCHKEDTGITCPRHAADQWLADYERMKGKQ